jgi:hypothetical protein
MRQACLILRSFLLLAAAVSAVDFDWMSGFGDKTKQALAITVGDTLRLTSLSGHNVIEVRTKAEFDGCSFVRGTIRSGNTATVASASMDSTYSLVASPSVYTALPATVYLVCGVAAHCAAGQKLALTIAPIASVPTASISPTSGAKTPVPTLAPRAAVTTTTPTLVPRVASTSAAPTVNVPCSGQAAADTVASMFIKAMVDAGKAMDLLPQLPGGATGECGTCITTKMGSPKSVAAECLGKHLGSVATAVPTFRFLAARTLRPSTAAAQVCTGGDTGLCRSAGRGSVHRGQHAIIEQRSS